MELLVTRYRLLKIFWGGFIRDGYDEKSACGLVVGMVSSEFSSAQKEWNLVTSSLE